MLKVTSIQDPLKMEKTAPKVCDLIDITHIFQNGGLEFEISLSQMYKNKIKMETLHFSTDHALLDKDEVLTSFEDFLH